MGEVFDASDKAAFAGSEVELSCVRFFGNAVVFWETVNPDDTIVDVLYDSRNPQNLPENYEFTNSDPEESNDFTIRVTVAKETSILTRCTISDENAIWNDASSTAMIFTIGENISLIYFFLVCE